MKGRVGMIVLVSVLFLAAVAVVGESMRAEWRTVQPISAAATQAFSTPIESGVFRRSSRALAYIQSEKNEGRRNLAQYYQARAFDGAPPTIPHETFDEKGFGGSGCLGCHGEGEYVPKLGTYAPVTPHPEMTNCKQCHVAKEKVAPFRSTSFAGEKPPGVGGAVLPGSPPPIPHTLAMRNNCLACHAGPSAPKEIRTTHPNRVNCRQCHAAVEEGKQQDGFVSDWRLTQ